MKKILRHRDLLFSTLSEITSLINAGHDKKIIFGRLLDCSLTVLEAERVYLLEIDGERINKYTRHTESPKIKIETLADAGGLVDWMIKEGTEQEQFQRGGELAFDVSTITSRYLDEGGDSGDGRVIISAPLVAKKSMFGLLVAIHRNDGKVYAPEDINLLTILSNQAAIAVENALLYQKLEKEAITDELTSVYNYRYLISSLENEIKRARRFKQTFSFVMVDVDNLKAYNDRLGHISGSQALREMANVIKANCREIDLVSKYGGDEFGLLLPQTKLAGAHRVIERVISAVANHCFDGKTPGLLTCSAGVSSFPGDGETSGELINAADKALYQAKRAGKNAVLSTAHTTETATP